ncbi:unnamed protein product [Kluyveromyces dobzhanskii CBS 2104]|uniref:WGS project CCBQ000000000 data, contig 00102 n=1 Tax=Kluyveromyces dobzhanskii CBS 2104 TaxID=1427455 RepID=A0A0A8L6R7_9SACH|nr:unnamed protein product [Kluyveromyces dobzhanskii CBS 2104]
MNNHRDIKEESLDLKTLFVRGVPFAATDEEFGNFFSQFSPIKHAVIVKDGEGASRGFGFVSFAVEDDTKVALGQARKTKFLGRLLRIDIAKRRERSRGKGESNEAVEAAASTDVVDEKKPDDDNDLMKGKPKLIIRNMPWSCRDPTKLKKIFGQYGTVVETSIPRKRDGRLCGFAFVTMNRISNCKAAIEATKELKIDGRKVAVDFAIQKNRWEDYKNDHKELDEPEVESEDDAESSGEEEAEDKDKSKSDQSDIELGSDEELDEDDQEEDEEEEEEKEPEQSAPKQNRKEDFSIFVRNVPYDATKESLETHFTGFGPVKYALPVIDRETGLAKGTAFVAFKTEEAFNKCLNNAPATASTSLLISDDVAPEYVYEGRVLAISPTLDRESAGRMFEKNAEKRKEVLGKAPGEKDRRNLYLLNEGRIVAGSKLSQLLSPADMEVREKSYKLRVEQLKKNPTLHLSMTRLAIRNIPRAMTERGLKALTRKAVVEFAKEVNEQKRHALNKEEVVRSNNEKFKFMSEEEIEAQKKKDKKQGIVRQSKIIMEIKGAASGGRSRGYGFVEFRDHRTALMCLRWLNAHEVSRDEILEGLTDDEKKQLDADSFKKRRLVVEFAIENANVVKRRREKVAESRSVSFKRKRDEETAAEEAKKEAAQPKEVETKSGLSNDVKQIIGSKRRRKNKGRS